jgi:NH3-dependent NAD+ synthetase
LPLPALSDNTNARAAALPYYTQARTWLTPHCSRCRCETDKKLQVAVLLSGGVDSSLALRLLVSAGHSCRAFYLQIWFQVRERTCVM